MNLDLDHRWQSPDTMILSPVVRRSKFSPKETKGAPVVNQLNLNSPKYRHSLGLDGQSGLNRPICPINQIGRMGLMCCWGI